MFGSRCIDGSCHFFLTAQLTIPCSNSLSKPLTSSSSVLNIRYRRCTKGLSSSKVMDIRAKSAYPSSSQNYCKRCDNRFGCWSSRGSIFNWSSSGILGSCSMDTRILYDFFAARLRSGYQFERFSEADCCLLGW